MRDRQGRVLLLRHRFRADSWGLPGGHCKRRETLTQAAVREVREETGYEVKIGRLIRIVDGFALRKSVIYEATVLSGALKVDGFEIREAEWVSLGSLPRDMHEYDRQLLLQYQGELYESPN
jgi:8-oxo-dGTP diphosphatase